MMSRHDPCAPDAASIARAGLSSRSELADSVEPSLAAALQQQVATALASCPTRVVTAEELAARLEAAAETGEPAVVLRLHATDLCLALACLKGDASALSRFELTILPGVRSALIRRGFSDSESDEILQLVREQQLMTRPASPPGLCRYAGRGSLTRWLTLAAVRCGYKLRNRTAARPACDSGEHLLKALTSSFDLEEHLVQARYAHEVRAVFEEALATLPLSERNLLRHRFLDGLTVEQLGALYGVHHATVLRRIERTCRIVSQTTAVLLRERLQVGTQTVNSIVAGVRDLLPVHWSRLT